MILSIICSLHGYSKGERCPRCVKMKGDGPAVHIFKPMVYKDICETPLLIESKRQLKMECEKHGVRACRLM